MNTDDSSAKQLRQAANTGEWTVETIWRDFSRSGVLQIKKIADAHNATLANVGKPTTGQRLAVASEWTGLTLSRLIKEKGYKGAADAHNAALAAERERTFAVSRMSESYVKEIQQLREQLADLHLYGEVMETKLAAAQAEKLKLIAEIKTNTPDGMIVKRWILDMENCESKTRSQR